MPRRKSLGMVLCGVLIVPVVGLWTGGCSVEVGSGADGSFVSFTVLGETFTLSFGGVGAIATQANETVTVAAAVRLFEQTPPETPPTGQMTLPSTSVGVARRLTAKTAARSQALPLNGSATIRFKVAPGQSAALCDTAVFLAEYDLTLTMSVAAIQNEVYDLTLEAMGAMMANEVTICIEITADFDGEITIGEYFFAFGGGAGGSQPPSAVPPLAIPPGGLKQVPIDNAGGRAIVASINRIVGGISYGIVGVIEDKTAAVTVPAVDSSSVTVVPTDLGLLSVNTVYIAAHSSFVPDVADGVTLATLTINYTTGLTPTAMEFVTGSTTSEWSYDRPAHVTAYGGVQHAKALVLYDFDTMVDSTTVYKGYSYAVAIPVDNMRAISAISVTMADPATFVGSRVETGPLSTWASQAITGITLVGQPLVIATEACCFKDGKCEDITRNECADRSGSPAGENSSCENTECLGACCIQSSCEMRTLESCDATGGEYVGFAVACDPDPCPSLPPTEDEPFQACCFPPTDMFGWTCNLTTFDFCVEAGGDPQALETGCPPLHPDPCPEACCFDDGQCVDDTDTATCATSGGTPAGPASICRTSCLGACCKPDGTCEQLTLAQCDTAKGDYAGLDTECALVECLGACCTSDGNCTDASKTDCAALDSTGLGPTEFQGPGTNCDTATCAPPPEYVVWYTSNVCCWGAPHINLTERAEFEAEGLRRNWPGGGIDPVALVTKTELQGGFATVEDARAWLCPQFTSWTFHFWCGSHIQGPLGGNWQGTAGCSYDPPLPQAETAPEFNGCP